MLHRSHVTVFFVTQEQCSKELEELEESMSSSSEASWKEVFTMPSILKPFGMAMTLMFFQQFCGVNALLFYLQDIFKVGLVNIINHCFRTVFLHITQAHRYSIWNSMVIALHYHYF